jgi:mannose-6-phosphate isomerase-like protein (cupin superfamily)
LTILLGGNNTEEAQRLIAGILELVQHAHDHGVMILRGQGQVLLGDEEFNVGFGDSEFIQAR